MAKAIHHTLVKKAEKNGLLLVQEDNRIHAFSPRYNARVYGDDPKDALAQGIAFNEIKEIDPEATINEYATNRRFASVSSKYLDENMEFKSMVAILTDVVANYQRNDTHDTEVVEQNEMAEEAATIPAQPKIQRNEAGIALDGAIAHAEGTLAADCPFDEDSDEAQAWYEAWDAHADADPEVEEGSAGGSVVSSHFRAKYAELGHPTHCGDWLAEQLNARVLNKGGTNMELFEAICAANGVDMSKYNKESRGWQGRFRMTGRNLIAKKVAQTGTLQLVDEEPIKAPADWLAEQQVKGRRPKTA